MTTPEAMQAMNRVLSQVADQLDVVVRVCAWCLRIQSIDPAAVWGSPGVTHTMCARCEREDAERKEFDDA